MVVLVLPKKDISGGGQRGQVGQRGVGDQGEAGGPEKSRVGREEPRRQGRGGWEGGPGVAQPKQEYSSLASSLDSLKQAEQDAQHVQKNSATTHESNHGYNHKCFNSLCNPQEQAQDCEST